MGPPSPPNRSQVVWSTFVTEVPFRNLLSDEPFRACKPPHSMEGWLKALDEAAAVGAMGQMTPPRPPSAGMLAGMSVCPPPPETPATDKGSKHRSRINGSGVTSDDDSVWTLGKWLKTVDGVYFVR